MPSCLCAVLDCKVCVEGISVQSNCHLLKPLTLRVVLVMLLPEATTTPSKTKTHLQRQSSPEATKEESAGVGTILHVPNWHFLLLQSQLCLCVTAKRVTEAVQALRLSVYDHRNVNLAQGFAHVLLMCATVLIIFAVNICSDLHLQITIA